MKGRCIPAIALLWLTLPAAGMVAADSGHVEAAADAAAYQTRSGGGVIATLPHRDIESREEKARKYRSCLFTYLPRMGSDVAAEIIRDACKAEYMPADDDQ